MEAKLIIILYLWLRQMTSGKPPLSILGILLIIVNLKFTNNYLHICLHSSIISPWGTNHS